MKRTALKRKPFRTKLTPLRTLKRKVWHAVSLHVRKRDKNCVTCKVRPAEHCGHYRHNTERNAQLGGNALWYDLRNLNGQCAFCNTYNNGAPNAYAIYLEEVYGHGILEDIEELYRTPRKWTREELENIVAGLVK